MATNTIDLILISVNITPVSINTGNDLFFSFRKISLIFNKQDSDERHQYTMFSLLPYFMCANSEGSGETAPMRSLA